MRLCPETSKKKKESERERERKKGREGRWEGGREGGRKKENYADIPNVCYCRCKKTIASVGIDPCQGRYQLRILLSAMIHF